MLAYDHRDGDNGQRLYPSLSVQLEIPFTDQQNCHLSSTGTFPVREHQQHLVRYQPHNYYPHQCANTPHQIRQNFQMVPFTGTMEPQMMFKQADTDYLAHLHNRSFDSEACTQSLTQFPHPVPDCQFEPRNQYSDTGDAWCERLPSFAHTDLNFPPQPPPVGEGLDDFEDGDDIAQDKPYAQLIYEALKQAPGHRMLLRDIYDWFIQNTRKPCESGTNGWQNSIRHNLSMNQAFENDKNDPTVSQGARKANSMWVLTEYAVKHGVQSTTRYRKSGNSKKTPHTRAPALQRQRSGAKGGRAARRAAHLKRQEEHRLRAQTLHTESNSPDLYGLCISPLSTTRDQWSIHGDSPITPTEEQFPTSSYTLPYRSCYHQFEENMINKSDMQTLLEQDERLRQMLSAPDSTYDSVPSL